MNRVTCCICSSKLHHIYSLDNFPLKLCCVPEPIYEKNVLSFSQCESCKTIQLSYLLPLSVLYSDSHNTTSIGNIWKQYFKLFSEKIQPIVENKNILEIGCPSGKIVSNVKNFNKWFIVEPNKNLEVIFPENVIFIQKFFDNDFFINDEINVIIHSHLFEHIYDFNEFLNKCYNVLSKEGEMFFGIPNMQNITESQICPFLGIFFEHTCFLNNENVNILLNKNNFEVIETIYYETHSILYHCKKTNIFFKNIKPIQDYYDKFTSSIDIYSNFVCKSNNYIANTVKDVYIFGASYNTQFLISLGLDLTKIKGILDNCKEKQDKFLYGYNLKIYDPSVIIKNNCIIIVKNGYYSHEIIKQICELNIYTDILFE